MMINALETNDSMRAMPRRASVFQP